MSARRPVLVVQHEADCPPAWLGDGMERVGARLDVRRPYAGEPLPDLLHEHAGLLVLGGAMGADDDAEHGWLPPTRRLLRLAYEQRVPTLGVCLGHQLLAAATGGLVAPRTRGRACGLLPVGWTEAAAVDPLFGALARTGGYDVPLAVHWNEDLVVELPPAAVPLAYSHGHDVQAMRLGAVAWGIQSHPEAGVEVVGSWLRQHPQAVGGPEEQLLADLAAAEATGRLPAAWEPLATGFGRLCATTAAASQSSDSAAYGVR